MVNGGIALSLFMLKDCYSPFSLAGNVCCKKGKSEAGILYKWLEATGLYRP